MTSDSGARSQREAYVPVGPGVHAARSDDSLRRLLALAARAVDMADARVSLRAGATNDRGVSTAGYDESRGQLVDGLDAAVAVSGEPLVVSDLADEADQESSSAGPTPGAYLGVPLLSPRNTVIGVLHVLDRAPRPIVARHVSSLAAFGRAISDHLALQAQVHAFDVDAEDVADVGRAIRAGNIAPWYQPVVDLSTGKIVGLEALARRTYPEGRFETPAAFVPIAERSDLIVDLDIAVARTALSDLKQWQLGHPILRMSVNLSGRHLDRADWVAGIVDLAAASGVSPSTVQLEITETSRPVHSIGDQVQLARSLGFSLWLDDFGSGWSGLRDLLHLPVDGIKLDQSFAEALGTRVSSVLVRALTTAATELGLKVTIEGIENSEQAALARELGCDYGQGYLWSAPVPAAGVARLLN